MENIYKDIDTHSDRYLAELFTLLKQPSISSQGIGLADCAALLAGMMEDAGIRAEIMPMGGKNNPPLVYGEVISPGAEKTLLVYGHFDVQPPDPLDAWHSPPFEPTIRDGRIFCRGSADNKGQLFAHVKAVESVLRVEGRLPVNLKFLFDPEEEIGSPSLDEFVVSRKDFFKADFAYNSDGPMDASGRPILSFGNRGNCYVEINHQGANRDLHSGQFGGPVPNPNWRVIAFLNTLRDSTGRVAIEGFYDGVIPPNDAEIEAMAAIPFDESTQLAYLGLDAFDTPRDTGYWEKVMFQPTLNVCGYVSGYGGEGNKTVLPCSVKVKIDMRLVKNQHPEDIFEKFRRHMETQGFGDLELTLLTTYRPAKTPIDHPMSQAVISAVRQSFDDEPIIYPVTGGSNPSSIICDSLKIPIVKVPYGNHDECNHAPNENMQVDLFFKGIKCSATVFDEVSRL